MKPSMERKEVIRVQAEKEIGQLGDWTSASKVLIREPTTRKLKAVSFSKDGDQHGGSQKREALDKVGRKRSHAGRLWVDSYWRDRDRTFEHLFEFKQKGSRLHPWTEAYTPSPSPLTVFSPTDSDPSSSLQSSNPFKLSLHASPSQAILASYSPNPISSTTDQELGTLKIHYPAIPNPENVLSSEAPSIPILKVEGAPVRSDTATHNWWNLTQKPRGETIDSLSHFEGPGKGIHRPSKPLPRPPSIIPIPIHHRSRSAQNFRFHSEEENGAQTHPDHTPAQIASATLNLLSLVDSLHPLPNPHSNSSSTSQRI